MKVEIDLIYLVAAYIVSFNLQLYGIARATKKKTSRQKLITVFIASSVAGVILFFATIIFLPQIL